MTGPRLTFFCELDRDDLIELFKENIIENLKVLNARISLGILDFSTERVEVVKKLNEFSIPVIAWLLLPEEQGYWLNSSNLGAAFDRYQNFLNWTQENSLSWSGVGLDIEPNINELKDVLKNRKKIFPLLFDKYKKRNQLQRAERGYQFLVNQIQSDGYFVESYQIPIIEDERRSNSYLIRRISGLVDIQVNREVWMLYSSMLRPHGKGILGSYAPDAEAIGIGITGGGVELDLDNFSGEPLSWKELARDLRLAWRWCDDVYLFSLEGCVEQNFLEELTTFSWDQPLILPLTETTRIDRWRGILRTVLWVNSHIWKLLFTIFGVLIIIKTIKYLTQRS